LIEQDSFDQDGGWVTVKQKSIGFGIACTDECFVFVRPESVEMWRALEAQVTDGGSLLVGGPPGTGKSTEAWAWARWRAMYSKQKVTWFHFTNVNVIMVEINGSTGIMTSCEVGIADVKDAEGDVLLVDGVTKESSTELLRSCTAWRSNQPGRIFVAISSVSIGISEEHLRDAKVTEFIVPSWEFKQFETACKSDDFFSRVRPNLLCPNVRVDADKSELLLAKYAFAGGCARWMFDFSYDTWLRDFEKHLEKVADYKNIFGEASGDATRDAVNHLRGLSLRASGKKYFFISQHTLRELSKKCDNKRRFILDSYKKARDAENPSYLGWIFEFDVDFQLDMAKQNQTKVKVELRGTDAVEELCVTDYITYTNITDIVTRITTLNESDTIWAKPQLWCQKAFDFLYFQKNEHGIRMGVVNASHAKRHSVLLHVVKTLAASFQPACVIEEIRFDFYVPPMKDFQVDKVTGSLAPWKNFRRQLWFDNKDRPQDYLDESFIVIANFNPTE
jgi:hypothetical protein